MTVNDATTNGEGGNVQVAEGDQHKANARQKKSTRWNLTSQNFHGLRKESDHEELSLMMKRQNIDMMCGQEAWLADTKSERWDTGEVLINFGKDFGTDDRGETIEGGRSEGVCFLLNKKMAAVFEKGGKRAKKYCPRLATMRLPVSPHEQLYIVNAHYPDSGQPKARRAAFQRRLESALAACKQGETLVLAGDFNAAMGTAEGDTVVGEYGLDHVNEAGRQLHLTASMYDLVDLVSQQEQLFYGTWVHCRSKKWHQLDRIFMRSMDLCKVHKCINAPMLVDSDHFSVRVHARCDKPAPPPKNSETGDEKKGCGRLLWTEGHGREAGGSSSKRRQAPSRKWHGEGCSGRADGCSGSGVEGGATQEEGATWLAGL